MSEFALAAVYWVHMLATVAWIGGLSALALFVLPAAQHALDPAARARLMEGIQRRLDPLAWFSLALLTGSGLFQMSANPSYEGFLSISGQWATAIFAKHLVFGLLIVSGAVVTWVVLPGMRRNALRLSKGLDAPEAERLERINLLLLRGNLFLAVIILALTALARVS